MGNLFSMRGRIGRRKYVAVSLLASLVVYAYAYALSIGEGGDFRPLTMLGVAVVAAGWIVQVFLAVRRLHDLGQPGWHVWLFCIPFYNIYLALVLCITPGSASSNDYGPSPA